MVTTLAHVEWYDNDAIRAIAEFESLDDFKWPDNKEGETLLGEIQAKIDQERQAAEDSESSSEGDSAWQDKLEKAANSLGEKNKKNKISQIIPQDVFQYLRKEIGIDSEEGIVLFKSLGIYCLEHGFSEIAWRTLTRLRSVKPEDETLECPLALSYALREQEELAINELVSLLGKNYYNRYANVNLGYIYKRKKNLLLARKYFFSTKQLLDKSQGYYDMEKFRALGDHYYDEESYKRSLKIYQVLLEEKESIELLDRTGHIYVKLEKYDDALMTFEHIQKLDPDNKQAQASLRQLNQLFLDHAENLMEENKWAKAAKFFEKSLEIERSVEVMKRLLSAYELLKNTKKIKKVLEQLRNFEEEQRVKELEDHRVKKVEEAKNFESHHLPYKAIRSYEEALRLQLNKEVFISLANLYKKTKQDDMIEDLTNRYNRRIEHEQRMEQYQKDTERRKRAEMEDEKSSKGEAS